MKLLCSARCIWKKTSQWPSPTVDSGSVSQGWGSRRDSVIITFSQVIWIHWLLSHILNSKAVGKISSHYTTSENIYFIHEAGKGLGILWGTLEVEWWLSKKQGRASVITGKWFFKLVYDGKFLESEVPCSQTVLMIICIRTQLRFLSILQLRSERKSETVNSDE